MVRLRLYKLVRPAFAIAAVLMVSLNLVGCIEELPISTEVQGSIDPDNTLVVEGTLTDRVENQLITLRKAASFANDSIIGFDDIDLMVGFIPFYERNDRPELYVSGAQVRVVDDSGQVYNFIESEVGRYRSATAFAAQTGIAYQLQITTPDGTEVLSEFEALPVRGSIENFYVERTVNEFGVEGVGFFVDAQMEDTAGGYLRYDFEETYKVIAPQWRPVDFRLTNYDPCGLPAPTFNLDIVDREEEQQVCFGNEPSREIVQFNSTEVSGGGVDRIQVHFINREDYKIMHRYSMQLRQLIVDGSSFSYYDKLRSFSKSETVFNQIQAGFLNGNLEPAGNSDLTVIGYFSVATVSQTRLFFNFDDLFPAEAGPDYPIACTLQSVPTSHVSYCYSGPPIANDCPLSLIERINQGLVSYIGPYSGGLNSLCPDEYVFVERPCGDCRILGRNQVPDFWIEN